MMGWDWRLRTAASTGLLFILGWFAMWTMVWWYRLRLTSNLSTRALWKPEVLSSGPVSSSQYWLASLSAETSLVAPSTVRWSCHLRHLWSESESGRWKWEFILSILVGTSRDLLHAVKSCDIGSPALLPIPRKVCCGFLSLLKIHRLGRVRTRNFWVQLQAH
jgi:hypothetical protein